MRNKKNNIFFNFTSISVFSSYFGFILSGMLFFTSVARTAEKDSVFRFSVNSDLERMDPVLLNSPISSYLHNLIYAPLMRYQNHKLEAFAAESCRAISTSQYKCRLRKDLKWSDGKKVSAQEYVQNWDYLKKSLSPRLNELGGIKSVKANGPRDLIIQLNSADREFLYRLIDPAFSPRANSQDPLDGTRTIGPYYVKLHTPGRSYDLAVNSYFFIANQDRPRIEVLIVDSDNTALSLFNTKKLNFLRRLTAENIDVYKKDPGFMQIPLHRMDYIGISEAVSRDKKLNETLVYSIQPAFADFQKLFSALGPPGCVGLVTDSPDQQICFQAKKVTRYSDAEAAKLPRLKLMFATQGGDDIRRGMELFQAAWKKNSNVNIELVPTEWGVMNQLLKANPPPLFRRGVPLQRPTCLAALEVFESNSPDNFVQLKDKEYDSHVRNLRIGRGNPKAECRRGLDRLLKTLRVIPMGPLYYTMLSDNKFDGILINELNQIDLSGLKLKAR